MIMQDWKDLIHTYKFLVHCKVTIDGKDYIYKKNNTVNSKTYRESPEEYNKFILFNKNNIVELVSTKKKVIKKQKLSSKSE